MSLNRHYETSAPRRWHRRPLLPSPSPKVDYRRTTHAPSFSPIKARPQGTRSHTSHGVDAMIALVEGHPNLDVIVFYALASVILAATLYYFHHRQIE
jgi:hypothetical protein